MEFNTIGLLVYATVAIVAAIISATIIRAKLSNLDRFDCWDVFLALLLGAAWPLAIVGGVVYLASDFLYGKFYK